MTVPVAHIAGLPVEETLGMLAPAGTVAVGAMSLAIRERWRRLRGARGAPHAEREARP